MKLLLFDIDGTLINSGGSGKRAMNLAFEQLYGYPDILDDISLSGRTDDLILQDAFEKAKLSPDPEKMAKYKKLYFNLLEKEITKPNSHKRIMPGVNTLLQELNLRQNIYLGLLSGNWQNSGYIKIRHFNLDSYFPFGAFSDDATNRSELVPIAISRFESRTGFKPSVDDVYVIGDTPRDIECTKPHGVKSVAVAASFYKRKELETYNPDYLFDDFNSINDVLQVLG